MNKKLYSPGDIYSKLIKVPGQSSDGYTSAIAMLHLLKAFGLKVRFYGLANFVYRLNERNKEELNGSE